MNPYEQSLVVAAESGTASSATPARARRQCTIKNKENSGIDEEENENQLGTLFLILLVLGHSPLFALVSHTTLLSLTMLSSIKFQSSSAWEEG